MTRSGTFTSVKPVIDGRSDVERVLTGAVYCSQSRVDTGTLPLDRLLPVVQVAFGGYCCVNIGLARKDILRSIAS